MNKAVTVLIPSLLLTLSACAPLSRQPAAPAPAQQMAPADKAAPVDKTAVKPPAAVSQQPATQAAPNADSGLTPPLLYHILLAEIAGQRGHLGISVESYLAAARESSDPRVAERATRIAVYARDNQRALVAARRWAELAPSNMEAQQVVAALLLRAGKPNEALKHLQRVVVEGEVKGYHGYLLVTRLLSRERDKKAAMAVMRKLVAGHENKPEALYALGHLAMLSGEYAEARQAVARVITLRPGWTEAYILQAGILEREGDKAGALKTLRDAVKRYPDKQDLRLYYARKLIDERQLAEARTQFATLLKQDPKNSDALFALGLLEMQAGKLDLAEQHFKRLAQNGERAAEASYFLGQIKEADKQPKAALRWYERVRGGRYFIDAQIRIALLTAQAGNLDAARARLQGIEARTPRQQQKLYLAEGELLRKAKRYQAAFDLYSEALTQLPDDPDLLYARSLVAEKIDKLDVVESDLKRILAADPNNVQALNALGYTLADRTQRYKEALGYIQRALDQQPEDPAILDSMGWVQYRLGHYEEAVRYLRKAYAGMKDAEVGAHLGEVLWVMGQHQAARKVWNEALRLAPDDAALRKVIHRFTKQ